MPPLAISPEQKKELVRQIIDKKHPMTSEGVVVYDLNASVPMKAKILGLVGAALAAIGCAHLGWGGEDGDGAVARAAYVDKARAPARVPAGERVEVVIEGSLPDPAWEVVDVEVVRTAGRVRLTPRIRRKTKDPAMQVIVPFERTVPIEGLANGKWTIEVKGHGDTAAQVEVQVGP